MSKSLIEKRYEDVVGILARWREWRALSMENERKIESLLDDLMLERKKMKKEVSRLKKEIEASCWRWI